MAQDCGCRRCFSRRRREAPPKRLEEERQLCVVRPRPLPEDDVDDGEDDEVAKEVIDSFNNGGDLAARLPCPNSLRGRRYAATTKKRKVYVGNSAA